MPVPLVATLNNPYGPQITFETENVLPPSAFYVSPDDGIYLTVVTTALNVGLIFVMRFLTPQGEVKVDSFDVPIPTGTPGTSSLQLPPVEGYILSANVVAAGQIGGSCYVQVQIVRGIPSTPSNAGFVMMQGYVTQTGALCWPNQAPAAPFTGPGAILTLQQTFAPGTEVNFTPPAFTRWSVLSFQAVLSASSAGGTRQPALELVMSNGFVAAFIPAFGGTAPSAQVRYLWYGGAPFATAPLATDMCSLPVPNVITESGLVLTATQGLDAGDQWLQATICVEQWSGR